MNAFRRWFRSPRPLGHGESERLAAMIGAAVLRSAAVRLELDIEEATRRVPGRVSRVTPGVRFAVSRLRQLAEAMEVDSGPVST